MMSQLASSPFAISGAPTETELLSKYFRVLGDDTRLKIIELLIAGEQSVGALVDSLGVSQPQVSNHLACLRWCGFVNTRREHRRVYYSVADPRVVELTTLARALLRDNEEHVAACETVEGSR